MSRQITPHNDDAKALAAKETWFINILRIITLILLLSIATLASLGVYSYTASSETAQFEGDFKSNAQLIIDSLHDIIDSHLGAINALADTITSHAISAGEKFPRVTLPDFAVYGSNARIQGDAFVIQWSPLVTDENRLEWEEYALANRFQLNEAYDQDTRLRDQQDDTYGLVFNYTSMADERPLHPEDTILDDGTKFHPRIYSNGAVAPRGDEPDNSGPYLPLWQRSPVNSKRQSVLNFNLANSQTLKGVLLRLLQTGKAIMNRAEIALPKTKQGIEENLILSQYRKESYQYLEDPVTFIAYPVFDSFDEDRQMAGVLSASTYWRILLNDILPEYAKGYICVLENSYNQTLAYKIDGKRSAYLGEGGLHDSKFGHLESSAAINEHVNDRAKPKNRSYTQVPLSREFGRYRLRIYPTQETKDHFVTNKPWVYTVVVLSVFFVTAIVLVVLDRFVA